MPLLVSAISEDPVTARRLAYLSATFLALVLAPQAAAGGSLFASLDGAWSGSGKVKLDSGKSERIKCKGYYNAKSGGAELGVAIDCANAAVRINMRAKLVDAGGKVSGTWEEREFNQSGEVSGKASADKLTLSFAGGITGSMSIATSEGGQTVTISTGGPGFVGAELQFSKSGA
jgi:hypothetical protein